MYLRDSSGIFFISIDEILFNKLKGFIGTHSNYNNKQEIYMEELIVDK